VVDAVSAVVVDVVLVDVLPVTLEPQPVASNALSVKNAMANFLQTELVFIS
jgi:hypothetical protein